MDIGDNLLLELGWGVREILGRREIRDVRAAELLDGVSLGLRVDLERIWSDRCCWMDWMMCKSRRWCSIAWTYITILMRVNFYNDLKATHQHPSGTKFKLIIIWYITQADMNIQTKKHDSCTNQTWTYQIHWAMDSSSIYMERVPNKQLYKYNRKTKNLSHHWYRN